MTATRRVVSALDALGGEALRVLPEEVPVAIVVNGSTLAVMMATPADLSDFARGFVVTEGVAEATEVGEIEIVAQADGIEARLWLPAHRAEALDARRRAAVGPVGCGLCGIDSLAAAVRPLPGVPQSDMVMRAGEIGDALAALRDQQPLHDETHAVHAAGFWQPGRGTPLARRDGHNLLAREEGHILLAREDVGRHNALDKLVGALVTAGVDPASGAVVLTSRLSLDMVQKCVTFGAPVLVSVSQPTAAAVRAAEAAGLTLATMSRGATHIYTHPARIHD